MSVLSWWVDDRNPAIGDQITVGGTPVDLSASTVTFKMRAVGSATLKVNASVTTKDSSGNWTYAWAAGDLDTEGEYLVWVEVVTSGKTQTVWESLVSVREHDGSHLYVEPEQVKESLNLSKTTYADLDVDIAVRAACRAIDDICGRRFWKDAAATQVRYYTPIQNYEVEIDDLIAITSLKTDPGGTRSYSTTWTEGQDFDLYPYNATSDNWRPYTSIRRRPFTGLWLPCWDASVEVTAQFGWDSVPYGVQTYASILAARLVKRKREAPLGFVGMSMEGIAVRLAQQDPDMKTLIGDYMKDEVLVG